MYNSIFDQDEDVLQDVELTLESVDSDNPSEFWDNSKNVIDGNLKSMAGFLESKDGLFKKRLLVLNDVKRTLKIKGVRNSNTPRIYPLGEKASIFYTLDGYMKHDGLLEQLELELKLNEILFDTFPRKLTTAIKQLTTVITKANKASSVEQANDVLLDELRNLDHPTELMTSGYFFPNVSFLMGVVLMRPKVDNSLPRSNLEFLGQQVPVRYIQSKISDARARSIAHGNGAEFKSKNILTIPSTELSDILTFAEKLLTDTWKYSDKYTVILKEFKELDNAITRLCTYSKSQESEVLSESVKNVVAYASSLTYLQMNAAKSRIRHSSIVSQTLVKIVRDIVGIIK